ncbi:MAG: 4Fe-4S binding protein [Desulfohalobiaceae bacterium]
MLQILILGVYACFIGHILLPAAHTGRIRSRIWLLFSVVFFSQLGLGLAGMETMLMTGELHMPVPALIVAGPVYRGEGLFMPILHTATILLVGPAWCSWLCYIGTWDDWAAERKKVACHPVPKLATHILRPVILFLIIGTALLLRKYNVPVGLAFGLALGFGLAGVGVMVFVSSRTGHMIHCTVFCPIGLISNLAGWISPWRLRIDSGCTRCGLCSRTCRYSALEKQDLENGRPGLTCTLCGDCVGQCPHGLIGYRFPGLRPEQARSTFMVLAVTIHVLFLGVARI